MALAAGLGVTAVLAGGLPAWIALIISALAALPLALRRSSWVIAPLLPLLAIAGTGDPTTALAWTACGWALGWSLDLRQLVTTDQQRRLMAEIHMMTHERDTLHRHLQRYPALLESCMSLSSARDIDLLAQVLCRKTCELIPGWHVVQVYFNTEGLPTCHAQALAPEHQGEVDEPTAAIAYVSRELRPLVQRDGNMVLSVMPLRSDRRSGQGQDSAHRHVFNGALVVRHRSQGVEDHLLLDILKALARLGGLGLASVDLLDEARSLALHDDLTGLYGRHEFNRRMNERLADARRKRSPLGLVMVDMDHLKKYNDTYGHPAGDQALRHVAQAIRSNLPEHAIACRYGGEEFGVLLPECDAERTAEIAERIRSVISRSQPTDDDARQVTASLGWSTLRDNETIDELIQRADDACYRAKGAGRNRVEAEA